MKLGQRPLATAWVKAVIGFNPTLSRGTREVGKSDEGDMNGGPVAIDSGLIAKQIGKAMSDEELKAELERLRNENAALKKGASSGIRMKVSEKGAVSIYGMGRFPVTLYKEQCLKLLDMSADIRAFIAANETQLKTKDKK
jgi:hypothetical protein